MAEKFPLFGNSFTEQNNPFSGRAQTIILEAIRLADHDASDNEIVADIYHAIKRAIGGIPIEEWEPKEHAFIAGAIAAYQHEWKRVPNGS